MILVITNIIGLTNAYICYKLFVFRTKGNVLREYSRFYLVYGTSIAINFILLPVLVELFHIHPLIAQASMIFFTVIVSYFGHKRFSFAIC
jgi:putative flippase GtrA